MEWIPSPGIAMNLNRCIYLSESIPPFIVLVGCNWTVRSQLNCFTVVVGTYNGTGLYNVRP